MRRLLPLLLAALLCAAAVAPAGASAAPPPIKHVFVIVLENKGFDETFGPSSPAPYLSQTLTSQGQLLRQYYGIGHASLDNYIAMVSGQAPNIVTQADCPFYTDFRPGVIGSNGQAIGQGCVYPATVPTIADQLTSAGLTWKGYMQDMKTACRHPAPNSFDTTQQAKVGDEYAARHNPFVYFHSVLDSGACAANDVDLSQLDTDLGSSSTTPSLAFITPDLCEDGHDSPCVDGRPGGLVSADAWLKQWVPKILGSAAFKQDGILIITFDESDGPQSDSSACCGEGPGPNTPLPGIAGLGGGRVGALVISPFVRGNTWSTTPYNHYSLLASLEDLFRLPFLGYAATPGLNRFGLDVYNASV
jgi:phospholipase C